jgi:hypothetical protein
MKPAKREAGVQSPQDTLQKNPCAPRFLSCSHSQRLTNPDHKACYTGKDNIAPDEDLWIMYRVQVRGSGVLFAVGSCFPDRSPRTANIRPNTLIPRSLLSTSTCGPTNFWLWKSAYSSKQVNIWHFSPKFLSKTTSYSTLCNTVRTSERPSNQNLYLNLPRFQNCTFISVFFQQSKGFRISLILCGFFQNILITRARILMTCHIFFFMQ